MVAGLAKHVGVGNEVPTAQGTFRSQKRLLRAMLYERIPSDRIARIAAENPALARKELDAVLESILLSADRRSFRQADQKALRIAVLDDILGFGPIEPLLEDQSVTEIMINGHDSVFFERAGKIIRSRISFDDDDQVRLIIERIIAPLGRRIDERVPIVNARLPEGHRLNAVIPPLSLGGPVVTIRKFRSTLYSLDDLQALGGLTDEMRLLLRWAVLARKNVAVSGGTGSGKTTLLNALSMEIPHSERIVTIEDSAELRFHTHPHVVSLEARPANVEGAGEVTIRDLVVNSLRMRPDRIVVGECRGGEAFDMLQAMNTGHDGSLTTLHANSPADAVGRLVTMVRYAADLPVDIIERQVGSAIDLVVQQDRFLDGSRKVTSIVEVSAGTGGVETRTLFRFIPSGIDGSGSVLGDHVCDARPTWIDQAVCAGLISVDEVSQWKSRVS